MKVRMIAGLGMTLLAVGLMAIYFLDPDFPGFEAAFNPGRSPEEAAPDRRPPAGGVEEVEEFLTRYESTFRALWTDARRSEWDALVDGSRDNELRREQAREALADYCGSIGVIGPLRLYRDRTDLSERQDRQIEVAWQRAARRPARAAEKARQAEDLARAALDTLRSPGRAALLAELGAASDTTGRAELWQRVLAVGPALKDDLLTARDGRNAAAREMGYSSWFALGAAGYDQSSEEMLQTLEELVTQIQPLYRHLHCWVKHELASRHGVEAPRRIPAHWLSDAWGSSWRGVVESGDPDALLADVQPLWIAESGERLMTSCGFDPLPLSYWGRSDLYPVPDGSAQRKSGRPATLTVDLGRDVRTLLNVVPDFASFDQAHRQTAAAYTFLAPDPGRLPASLRAPGCGALTLALPEWAALTARQVPYLEAVGLLAPGEAPEPIRTLMNQALEGAVVGLPWLLGTVAHWEHDFYERDLPRHLLTTRWWDYAGKYQGIVPPVERGEDACDPATVEALHERPGLAWDPALGKLIAYQLQRYLCRDVLGGDVHTTSPLGETRVGRVLQPLAAAGASRDWQLLLGQTTGEGLSAAPLLDYYAPLLQWLRAQNEGRDPSF